MSDDGDKIYPSMDYGYLVTRSNLLLSLNMLKNDLEWIWKEGKRWPDKKFDTYLHGIALRKRELLDIARSLMSDEDYEKYFDMVESILSVKYTKFSLKKMKIVERNFSPKKLV